MKNEKKVKSSCFVTQIDLALAPKLKTDLSEFEFTFTKPDYTVFSAKKKGISVTLYQSGKLMVQGKEMGEFIEFYLEPQILQTFTYSHPEEYMETHTHIGCDEAGKGDFFGPLCIAGVYGDKEVIKQLLSMGIKDTKKISDKKTLDLAKKIKDQCVHHIVKIGPQKYNELYSKFNNLNSLLAWGHSAVSDELVKKTGCKKVLIDKFASDSLIEKAVHKKNSEIELELKTHAEADMLVAAAAILARATFLNSLKSLGEPFDLELPKGASQKTQDVAISIVKKHGAQALEKICKKHFSTYNQVMQAC